MSGWGIFEESCLSIFDSSSSIKAKEDLNWKARFRRAQSVPARDLAKVASQPTDAQLGLSSPPKPRGLPEVPRGLPEVFLPTSPPLSDTSISLHDDLIANHPALSLHAALS